MPSRNAKRFLLFFSLLSLTLLISSTSSADFYFYPSFPAGSFTSSGLPGTPTIGLNGFTNQVPDAADPQHQCLLNTPGNAVTGSYSVWFGFSVGAGEVVIDTLNSNYDTIMTLYAYDPQVGNLEPIACNDFFDPLPDPEAFISTTVPTGRYVVQISRVDESAQAGLSLEVAIRYTATAQPPANDARANASSATIVNANGPAVKTQRLHAVTIDADERDIATEMSCPMTNVVWYEYTPVFDGYYNFSTSGSNLYYNDNDVYTDTMLTVITDSISFAPVPCADGANYAMAYNAQLNAGVTYHIGVGTFRDVNLLPQSQYKLKVTVNEILPNNDVGAILPNGGFEVGDTRDWKTKQFGVNDGVRLTDLLSGDYAIQIKAQNNGVTKRLSNSRVFPTAGGFIPAAEAAVVANYQYITMGNVKGTVSLTIQYSNRPSVVLSKPLVSNSIEAVPGSLYTTILDKTVTRITFEVKVTSGNGVMLFDNAMVRYFGGQALAAEGGLVPLPPAP